jgi:GT2 family glycosyltransferase
LSLVKITIITATTDNSPYVEQALDSTRTTAAVEIEHIIVHDGGDAFTEQLLRKYPHLRIIRGPGRGVTPAYNVALAAASGDFIVLLNSDDFLLPGSLEALVQASTTRPDVEVWTGGARIFEDGEAGERTVRTLDDRATTALTLGNMLDDLPLMTARFIRRSVYERIGFFDVDYPRSSDRELMIRMVLADVKEAPLGQRVSELRQHPGSTTIRNPGNQVPPYLAENIRIARRYMTQTGIPDHVRNTFRDWHARETLRKLYYELRARQLGSASNTLQAAFAVDWRWPWYAHTAIGGMRLRRRAGDSDLNAINAA